MRVGREPDHPAADSSAAGKNRGKPKRKPVGAVLLRKLQAAEAAAEGSLWHLRSIFLEVVTTFFLEAKL